MVCRLSPVRRRPASAVLLHPADGSGSATSNSIGLERHLRTLLLQGLKPGMESQHVSRRLLRRLAVLQRVEQLRVIQ